MRRSEQAATRHRYQEKKSSFVVPAEVQDRPGEPPATKAQVGAFAQVRADGGGESACTPDSVPAVPKNRRWRPSISAGGCPPAPAAYPGVSADGPSSPCMALLPVGFAEPPGSPRALVRSYRTVSPLPVRGRSGDRSRHRRSVLCGTFLRVAPTGCYPAPCPVESGRSSDRCAKAPGTRPPGRLATTTIVALRRSGSHRNRRSP
jgi:hypothetical protein